MLRYAEGYALLFSPGQRLFHNSPPLQMSAPPFKAISMPSDGPDAHGGLVSASTGSSGHCLIDLLEPLFFALPLLDGALPPRWTPVALSRRLNIVLEVCNQQKIWKTVHI